MLHDDVDQRRIHVGRHLLGVAADVEVRAVLEPCIQVLADAAQAVLHVLAGNTAVARKREVAAAQHTALHRILPFRLVQEFALEVTRTEEEPVASGGALRLAVLHEATERGDTRTGADHDHVARRVGRQTEALVLFDEDPCPGLLALQAGEKS